LLRLISEKYPKLLPVAREQLLWLVRELVSSRVRELDAIIIALLRQVISGDTSQKNTSLIEALVSMLRENRYGDDVAHAYGTYGSELNRICTHACAHCREWLFEQAALIPFVVYTLLRVIADHSKPGLISLREREVDLCCDLLRNKVCACVCATAVC
jgi:hypothetical protein